MASHPTTQKINPHKASNIEVHIQWLHSQALCLYGQSNGKDGATSFGETTGKLEWIEAMEEEMDAYQQNQTWNLVLLSSGTKAIGCTRVFKIKHYADGAVSQHKVRLVVKGYGQIQGIDYKETFALVGKMLKICSILSLAASKGWQIQQMDVKNVFLH